MEKLKLNKKNRSKALKILKKMDTPEIYNRSGVNKFLAWKQHQINHIVLAQHKITQEVLDNYIDLED